eukprot:7363753-Karenia_brevis.AAC.1
MMFEKTNEWNEDLWLVAIDFRKAFDLVSHQALWQALANQGVPDIYIQLLRNLYSNQTGMISMGVDRKLFEISRGTKQ